MRGLMRALMFCSALLLLGAGCSGDGVATPPPIPPGPGMPDAMPSDAATPDADLTDADTPDSSPPDAGTPDSSPPDASMMDASPADASMMDASPADASMMDASPADASMMDASPADASMMDASTMDASPADASMMDASVDAPMDEFTPPGDDAGFVPGDPCYMRPPGVACGAGGTCAIGYRCVNSLCGDTRCVPAGRPCSVTSDCPTLGECRTIGAPPDEQRVCWRAASCTDSRECPLGFSCETGSCVDRRIPCQLPPASCPMGFACVEPDYGTASFCARIAHPCRETSMCPLPGSSCLNVTGPTRTQCGLVGICSRNSDCLARQVCGADPDLFLTSCMSHGPCEVAGDCPVGMLCQNLAGDGLKECVLAGGSCSADADCPVRQVCATQMAGTAPVCSSRIF